MTKRFTTVSRLSPSTTRRVLLAYLPACSTVNRLDIYYPFLHRIFGYFNRQASFPEVKLGLDNILQQIRHKPGLVKLLRAASEEYRIYSQQPIKDQLWCWMLQSSGVTKALLWTSAAIADSEFQRELLYWLWKAAIQPVRRELPRVSFQGSWSFASGLVDWSRPKGKGTDLCNCKI